MVKEKKTKVCERCSKTFCGDNPWRRPVSHFCNACRGHSHTCARCWVVFNSPHQAAKYCSKKCLKVKRPTCARGGCNNEIGKKSIRCCGNACSAMMIKEATKKIRSKRPTYICEECGVVFQKNAEHNKGQFCSTECYRKGFANERGRKRLTWKGRPYSERLSTRVCSTCGDRLELQNVGYLCVRCCGIMQERRDNNVAIAMLPDDERRRHQTDQARISRWALPEVERKRRGRETMRRRRAANPNKAKARRDCQNAVLSGKMPRPKNCEICGKAECRLDAHHTDYSRSFLVVFICLSCHRKVHKTPQLELCFFPVL